MGLKGLSGTIAVESPPFIKPGQVSMLDNLWEPWLSTVKQRIRQGFVVDQDSFIVSDSLGHHTTDGAHLIGESFAPTDQRCALVVRQKPVQEEYLSGI